MSTSVEVKLSPKGKPRLRAVAEVTAEAHGRVGADRAPPVEDIGDAPRWSAEVERQTIGAQPGGRKLALEETAGM
jgi:hypothetical protein